MLSIRKTCFLFLDKTPSSFDCLLFQYSFLTTCKCYDFKMSIYILQFYQICKNSKKKKKKEVYIDILISNSFSLQFMKRKKTAYNIRLLF